MDLHVLLADDSNPNDACAGSQDQASPAEDSKVWGSNQH